MSGAHDAAARSWVGHLRDGGTATWHDWAGAAGAGAPAGDDRAGRLPGAAQLELLRRLNAETPRPHLVDHVLHRPGPGRGHVHLGLSWPPVPGPVASHQEVLRVATGVLADLTTRLPTEGAKPTPGPARRRTGTRSFVLDGLPLTVAGLRAELAASGLTEHRPRRPWFGGARPDHPDVVVLVVGPVADALREVWSRRVQEGSGRRWPRFVGAAAKQDALPGTADHLRTLERWAPRVGADNVHVVTGTGLGQQVAGLVGASPIVGAGQSGGLGGHLQGDPVRLTALQQVVLRRVNSVLPFLVGSPERDARRAALVRLMTTDPSPRTGPARLAVPVEHRDWVAASGVRLERELRRSGCAVHGDLAELHRADAVTGDRLRAGDILALMVRMIHRVDAATAPGEGGRR